MDVAAQQQAVVYANGGTPQAPAGANVLYARTNPNEPVSNVVNYWLAQGFLIGKGYTLGGAGFYDNGSSGYYVLIAS